MRDITDLIGRIFLSAIFIFEAVDTILYIDKTKVTMTQYGLPGTRISNLCNDFPVGSGRVDGTFGLPFHFRGFAAIAILTPVTFLVHDFWHYPKDQMRIQSILFMKDVAIIGGLLMLAGKAADVTALSGYLPPPAYH